MDVEKMKLSELNRPYAREILQRYYKTSFILWTSEQLSEYEKKLDIDYCVDAIAYADDGSGMSDAIQIKALRACESYWRTFTMQYFRDAEEKTEGEYFLIKAKAYLSGYADETTGKYLSWHLLDVVKIKEFIRQELAKGLGNTEVEIKPNKTNGSSFVSVPLNIIPADCILAKG